MAHEPMSHEDDAVRIELDERTHHDADIYSPTSNNDGGSTLLGSPISPAEHTPGDALFARLLPGSGDSEKGLRRKPVGFGDVSVKPLQNISDEDDGQPPTGASNHYYYHDDGGNRPPKRFQWKYETMCLVFSAVSFILIIILLSVFDDKSIQSWRAPFSINAVVAVLSAMFKGFLVLPLSSGIAQMKWLSFSRKQQSFANVDTYDQASRGAWGSFILIKRQFTGETLSPIAIMGALLVLALVASEPFSQAGVQTTMCPRVNVSTAWIPRSSVFEGSQALERGSVMLNSTFQLAAYQGLYDDYQSANDLMQPFVVCPTGNCTFPQPVSVQTLTMCHSCRDTSDKIYKSTPDGWDDRRDGLILTMKGYSENFQSRTELLSLVTNCSATDALGQTVFENSTASQWPDNGWNDTSMVNFQGIAGHLKNTSRKLDECKVDSYLGFDCGLRPCLKSFSSKMVNGKYSETEVDRHYLPRAGTEFRMALNETIINGTWTKCAPENDWTPTHNAIAYGRTPTGDQVTLYYPPYCVYSVTQEDYLALLQFLQDGLLAPDPTKQLVWAATQDSSAEVFGPAWQAKLWNKGQPSMDVVNRFAEGMSNIIGNYMRNNGRKFYRARDFSAPDRYNTTIFPDDWTRALGDAHYAEACIQVRWRYLAYPATLFVLVLAFFVAVVWDDYKSKSWGADWKLATLPMQFPALRNRPSSMASSKLRSKSYFQEASQMQVRLVNGEEGWVFSSGRQAEDR